ncbi:RagB/SusD family nutrient uptake outer membrane protein [Chitinophagaceae bacterium MMS25-I14]
MKSRNFNSYIKIITLAAVSQCFFSSCKKYLNVQPVSSFGADYTFSNTSNADKAVLGVYNSLTGDQAYGIRLSMYYAYDNDEMMGQGATPFPDNDRRDIAHYNVQPSNTQLAGPFNQLYAGVERANLCIYYIPRMGQYSGGSASDKAKLRSLYGEALTLRAQFLFELVRNWGDIPAQFEPSMLQTDLFVSKTDRDTIYNHILNDLAMADTLVPWRTQSGYTSERITQGAVRALRARIALFRGGYSLRRSGTMQRDADYRTYYQIAKDECAEIMQHRGEHDLNPSYKSVFKDAICGLTPEPHGEVIWEVAMAGGTGTSDSKLGYYNGPKYGSMGNSALTILPTYFYSFDSSDTRRDVTCAPYDINTDNTIKGRAGQAIVDGKFRRDWISGALTSSAQYFGVNWPLIRFSDVLLMYAEADNELNGGPSGTAVSAFEEVRKRGFGGNAALIGTTPTSYTDFFKALVKERSLELGGEGIRKYDLIRWNLLAQKISDTKTTLSNMANHVPPYDQLPTSMYYLNNSTTLQWYSSYYVTGPSSTPSGYSSVKWLGSGITSTILTYYAVYFQTNHSELLPIPQASIDANPKLTQDYGY